MAERLSEDQTGFQLTPHPYSKHQLVVTTKDAEGDERAFLIGRPQARALRDALSQWLGDPPPPPARPSGLILPGHD